MAYALPAGADVPLSRWSRADLVVDAFPRLDVRGEGRPDLDRGNRTGRRGTLAGGRSPGVS